MASASENESTILEITQFSLLLKKIYYLRTVHTCHTISRFQWFTIKHSFSS